MMIAVVAGQLQHKLYIVFHFVNFLGKKYFMSMFLKIQSKCNNAVKFVPMPCPSHSSINCDQSKPKDNQNKKLWDIH
jgi:hypothetical protein